ncbi:DapH/DapD/GlmU-related protein [Aquibacillus albus]|uniref:Phosphonate metabolism protein (Transferase hexapeptide repeat family) n=1 Tax=Aquibacillus albus TaxID=1168171 RepID=A0ABS2N583_9BACI|nr:DapH/DapD/GlmU-related protein [Aquibacillus albus]MBM7573309.1 phosphonate metabolism protein (transferase hexapeptide repeat family) [Aquibacillus albus]
MMEDKKLSEEPTIHETAIVKDCCLGEWTDIGSNSFIYQTNFGAYSYTAGDAQIIYADIGKFCSIASHVRINPGNHPMWRVTQHHATYRRRWYGFAETDDTEFFDWRKEHQVTIGHDVWIGHGAVVMPGVSVGTGAVIGAGAVVTKDVAPYTIAVGVPAKPIRMRFSQHIVEKLLQIAWWNWDRSTLEARFADLTDIETFVKKYEDS